MLFAYVQGHDKNKTVLATEAGKHATSLATHRLMSHLSGSRLQCSGFRPRGAEQGVKPQTLKDSIFKGAPREERQLWIEMQSIQKTRTYP